MSRRPEDYSAQKRLEDYVMKTNAAILGLEHRISLLTDVANAAAKYRSETVDADSCDCPDDDLCSLCELGFALACLEDEPLCRCGRRSDDCTYPLTGDCR